MKSNQQNISEHANAMGERILDGIAGYERKMRALTAVAFTFGFLAIAASILIVAAYVVLYRPKQMQLMHDFGARLERIDPGASAQTGPSPELNGRDRYDFPHIQVIMMNAVSFGSMLVAIAVGLLAAGTLSTLALIIVSRRAAMSQINANLGEITEQLKRLSAASSSFPH